MIKIDKVKIKNFKSLRDIDMSLSNLTLITGVNSSGKSSFIQTLLLLKQNEMVFDNKLYFRLMVSMLNLEIKKIFFLKMRMKRILR